MELLRDTNIDFLGRRRYFIAVSLLVALAGTVSLVMKGGPRLGIDFKGGTLVYVKFQEDPQVDEIRQALTERGLVVGTLQPFEDTEQGSEMKVDLDLGEDGGLTSARQRIVAALDDIYGAEAGKADLNNIGVETLTERLRSNEKLANSALGFEEIRQAAERMIEFRDSPPQSGLVKDFSEFASVEGVNPDIITALQEEAYLGAYAIRRVESVGPKIGRDLQWQAFKATLAALGGMLIYIAFRFEWIYGVASVAAVFHDVYVTIGFFSLFDREIDLTVIAALLTLVGYSMNDTIVIFDRVRENRKLTRRMPVEDLLNRSVNQTLARTLLTSGLTFIAVLCLFIFGGEVLRGFSFALVVGVIVGSYSSISVASPMVLWWQNMTAAKAAPAGRRVRA